MQIEVNIPNLNKIRMGFLLAPQAMARNLQVAISRTAFKIQRGAKDIIRKGNGYTKRPFDTGHMMRRVTVQVETLRARIYPDTSYAYYVHEGRGSSTKYGRRPFMQDAIRRNKVDIDKEFHDAVKKTMKGIK